jgi:hypothetical protein
MQDNTHSAIATTSQSEPPSAFDALLEHLSDLADSLEAFIQNNEEGGTTLAEVDRLWLQLQHAARVNLIDERYPVLDVRRYPDNAQIWEWIRSEASQIESDRIEEEEQEALSDDELRAQDERDYWQQTAASLAR